MSKTELLAFAHGDIIPRSALPRFEVETFRQILTANLQADRRLVALFAHPSGSAAQIELLAILAAEGHGLLYAGTTSVSKRYASLTSAAPQAHWFEREIAEQWALTPEGHPWLKPIRFHPPYGAENQPPLPADAWPPPGVTDYFRVEGTEIHEVAVGPVHAGIIEPGHFRFQCHGENVLHLEISLGYQHRGIERRLRGAPDKKSIHYIETAAGDTTIGHALTYCHLLEMLGRSQVPARAQALRGIALELERLANHTGDLGALAGDIGFLPTASFCGRLRGDWLNLTAVLCGNRFGRGLIRPGGLGCEPTDAEADDLLRRLDLLERDLTDAVELLWKTNSVMARFEETGLVRHADALALGLVGPAARASGVKRDVRHDFPAGIYRYAHIPIAVWDSGDVFARAFVRRLETQRSIAFIREQLRMLPPAEPNAEQKPLAPNTMAAALTEGWRGEICHVALTDEQGRFAHYKIVDPSFHNWFGLAFAMRNQQISDFPLCNKSFNLSYCGHDL